MTPARTSAGSTRLGRAPEFVVYDAATGAEVVRTSEGSLAVAQSQNDINTMSAVITIDGGLVYWHDSTGVKAYDIGSGTLTTVKDGADANWLDDVEDGVLAHQADLHYRGDAGAQAIVVNADPDASQPAFTPWSHGYLSPDAAHVAVFGGDQSRIIDVATHDDVTPPYPGYDLVSFGAWVDEDHFTFRGFGAQQNRMDLLECSIADASCTVVARDIQGDGTDPVIMPGMPLG